jgi:hypothetical protein
MAMAIVAGTVSLVISALILLGRERRGTQLGSYTTELADWQPVASDRTVASGSQ